jgi:phage terminase large subunit
MEQIKKNSALTFGALYQGDPKPSEEAMVYNDWVEIDEYPEFVDSEFYGLDFGYSNDPTACTRIGRTGQNIYVDELFYETGLTNQDILDRAHAVGMSTDLETICDKAEPKSIEELSRGYWKPGNVHVRGLNAIGCDKGPGSINAGIQKVKEFTVFFTKRSRNIKKERDNYQWIMAGGKATNTPIDAYNHALDGIRSAIFTKFGKPPITGTARLKTIQVKKRRLD